MIDLILEGTFDWRTLALTSTVSFLLLLIFIFIMVTCAFWRQERKLTETRWMWRKGWNGTRSHNFSQLMFKVKLIVTLKFHEECPIYETNKCTSTRKLCHLAIDVSFEIDSYFHFDFHILPANIPNYPCKSCTCFICGNVCK